MEFIFAGDTKLIKVVYWTAKWLKLKFNILRFEFTETWLYSMIYRGTDRVHNLKFANEERDLRWFWS